MGLLAESSCHDVLDHLYDAVYIVDQQRRIVFWNKSAVNLTGYPSDEVLGCRCSDSILVHVDNAGHSLCKDSCPLLATIEDGLPREARIFLHHKSGHRVPVRVRVAPMNDQIGHIIGAAEIFNHDSAYFGLAYEIEDLQRIALSDKLTGIGNRRFAEMSLLDHLSQPDRYGIAFGVLFIDIDNFKFVNDTYGHDIGDDVLKMTTSTMANSLRPSDVLCRWGGDEFLAIVSHVTPENLMSVGDKLKAMVEQSMLVMGPITVKVTISAGAAIALKSDTAETLMARADDLLYQSKQAGRNCVTDSTCSSGDSSSVSTDMHDGTD